MLTVRLNLQITGAREPIILIDEQGIEHEYLMSPLRDIDSAEIDLWLQCKYLRDSAKALGEVSQAEMNRLETVAANLSASFGDGAELIDCPAGYARLLWQSITRSHPEIPYLFILSLMQDERNQKEFSSRFQSLNSIPHFVKKTSETKESSQQDKAEVYCLLAQIYKYTFAEIAAMTPWQQLKALSRNSDELVNETVTFATEEEFNNWKLNKANRNV